ncbi:hypothetical protein ACLMJK_007803 [Lecanora helva]
MEVAPAVPEGLLRGLAYVSISWVTFAIGFVLVALRMFVRVTHRTIGWDDHLIVAAVVVAFFGSITNVYQVANGLGRHIDTLTAGQRSGFQKWTLIAEIQVIIGTCVTKISVSLFILRLINRTRKKTTYLIYALMATVIVTTVALVITFLLECRPLNAVYNPRVHGKCYSKHVVYGVAYGQGAVSIITDFACAALPIFVLRNLQMKRKTKIALSVIMGLGVLTAFLYLNYKKDVTHANTVNVIFAVLEENVGIIAATLPTIRPLFRRSITRINSVDAAKDTFTARQPSTRARNAQVRALEEGNLPLYGVGITKTTSFSVASNSRQSN